MANDNVVLLPEGVVCAVTDRKSTRLNSSHDQISYAVFCLKKKKNRRQTPRQTPPNTRDTKKPPLTTRCRQPRTYADYDKQRQTLQKQHQYPGVPAVHTHRD